MVNLLMKFYDITDGDIKIDGISIKDLSRENIHDLFVMVLQDTWLFNGTIRDNIKYNNTNISDEQIILACKVVGIDKFVNSLPNGLSFEITDNESISAGQKQLITIARGMLKDAPFLILDEATSALDNESERIIQKSLEDLSKDRTCITIAHRLSTIRNADEIVVIDATGMHERGTHDELMKLNGTYAKYYKLQFEGLN